MGVAVSGWPLARAVSRLGQLGVVSGTALALTLARRLQLGDPGGHLRRALGQFPFPAVAERILEQYYIPGGKPPHQPFKPQPFPTVPLSTSLTELTVAGNFAEVFLAKEGHSGLVGINYLEKIQIPMPASLFGAMLAGVDYVLMGAGVPRAIPGILDQLARGEAVRLRIDVADLLPGEQVVQEFDPRAIFGDAPLLKRPQFLAIVSSATLATTLARKSSGQVNGFIVEGDSAGGHNAPPRGPMHLSARGEPIYSERDVPDLERIRELGLPFWLAGSYADPDQLASARQHGAAGVQIGTAFAFCEESGLDADLKQQVLDHACSDTLDVLTDPCASPTGFPFKVLQLDGTLSHEAIYDARARTCDLGYLRSTYRKPDGSVGYRCPAEPVEHYLAKGGRKDATPGRKCLCNGLLATVGLGQVQSDGGMEPPILTAGDDVRRLARFLQPPRRSYSAADVLRYVLGDLTPAMPLDYSSQEPAPTER